MPAPDSLRGLLARWLIGPMVGLFALTGIVTYFTAAGAARDAYDSALLDPALAIASHLLVADKNIEIGLPAAAIDALRIDSADRVYFQVLGPENRRFAGNTRIPRPPPDLAPEASDHVFYSSAIDGRRVRIVALNVPHPRGRILVQVAETFVKRDRLVKKLLLSTLFPQLVAVLAAIALFLFGIHRGLKPLEQLRAQIDSRSSTDLHPVGADGTPAEMRSLVNTLNQLLARLSGAIDGQNRFIANAAHQLRTPLAGLKTHADLARRSVDPVEQRELIDMIAGETGRAGRLVNQLLALARAEPGVTAQIRSDPVNLRDVANHAAATWVARALEKDIDLGFELEHAWILGNALLLRELLSNLIDNAIAYTDSGGEVTVRTRVADHSAHLEVEDNGVGIPQSERARVFERFYRIPGAGGEGCGLGLAIVAEIAAKHDARVDLLTAGAGRGICARVEFKRIAYIAAGT